LANEINDFTHLHTHSTYSILDGENQLDALVKRVKELGMKQIALTDHGTMMGALNFYKACKKEGIKPILGVEAYITNDPDGLPKEERTRDNHHLVMIAVNDTGYKNLLNLVSNAQLHNFYSKPRISKDNLNVNSVSGIIATSACLGNEVNRVGKFNPDTKLFEDLDAMERAAIFYQSVFKDNYYLEIQDNDDPAGQQLAYNKVVIELGKQLGIKNVITADAHYTSKDSVQLHSMLMAMQLKKTYAEYISAGEMKYGPWFYVRSAEEMLQAARKYNCEEAFWNTCDIGNSCSLDIELGKYKTPTFNIEIEPDYDEFLKEHQ
jgi:DNA polymerase III subunit alpha